MYLNLAFKHMSKALLTQLAYTYACSSGVETGFFLWQLYSTSAPKTIIWPTCSFLFILNLFVLPNNPMLPTVVGNRALEENTFFCAVCSIFTQLHFFYRHTLVWLSEEKLIFVFFQSSDVFFSANGWYFWVEVFDFSLEWFQIWAVSMTVHCQLSPSSFPLIFYQWSPTLRGLIWCETTRSSQQQPQVKSKVACFRQDPVHIC